LSQYSVGSLAAELAKLVQGESELFVIGHSLGAYLGLALASRWFGVDVRGVLAIGPKISWPPADVQAAHELAMRPVRWYSNSEEAWSRYRRMSGLDTRVALADEWLRHGVTESAEGWRLSQDSRTFQVAGAPFGSLVSAATSRLLSGATASPGAGATASVGSGAKACLVLARGEHDAMVSTAELQAYCPDTYEIDAVGHNAHVEKPDEIVRLFGMLLK